MTRFILYLLESSALMAFFYLIYVFFLRRETFFELNRFFLICILVFSLLLPFVHFDFNSEKQEGPDRHLNEFSKLRVSYYEAMALWEFNAFHATKSFETMPSEREASSNINWTKISFTTLFILYAFGVMMCLSRTLWTLHWMWKMITTYPQEKIAGVKVIRNPNPIAPFSFFQYVFVYDPMVDSPEFNQILEHERTHIQQRHSLDLIFVQLLAAIFWFNPVIWRLIKSLKTTHEYIADKKIINSGYSLVEYQTLLLKQLISNNSFGLVHNFNLSFIKKRITMMQHKKSGWPGKVKVAVAMTCALIISAVLVQCNAKFEDQVSEGILKSDHTAKVNLPVISKTGYQFKGDMTDAPRFTISDNQLSINGENHSVDEIIPMFVKDNNTHTIVIEIDRDQTMGFVRSVEMELRKADKRKMLYLGQTVDGKQFEMPLMLPPTRENAAKNGIPIQPDIASVEAEGKTDILKIDLGDIAPAATRQFVYDFVQGHMQKQSSDYVVSFRYTDDDLYNDYLVSLVQIQEGFNQIYQERARAMFGKDYYDATKEEFKKIREGVPMAISIAEKN